MKNQVNQTDRSLTQIEIDYLLKRSMIPFTEIKNGKFKKLFNRHAFITRN